MLGKGKKRVQHNQAEIILATSELHPKQQWIINNAKRFNVIRCGRRFGKTELLIDRAIDAIAQGQSFGWFAPTYKVLIEPFRKLKDILNPVLVRVSESEKRIETMGGGIIEFWSLEDEDAGKSRRYARVGIDEAAMVNDLKTRWENSIRPTLSDLRGDAYFCSTPKGLNYFYDLHLKAEQGNEGWATFHASTYDNPYISKEEIDEAKKDLPSLVFAQEYLAEFVSGVGSLVSPDWLRRATPPPDGLEIAMGVDLAVSQKESADYTACVVLARCKVDDGFRYYVLDVDRIRGTLETIVNWIDSKYQRWRPAQVVIENVQAQTWACQELARKKSIPVLPLNPRDYTAFGNASHDKVSRAQAIIAKYEYGLLYHSPSITRLQEFEDEIVSFPIGSHDDMMDALVYAYFPFLEINVGAGLV